MISSNQETTPREREAMIHEKAMTEMMYVHDLQAKDKDIELEKLKAKWATWIHIPLYIVKLPVMMLFGIAYIVAVARKHEPSEDFWKFLR
jgi:hypothetical protein